MMEPNSMSKSTKVVDYLIIGGGITGAGLLRECKLRNVSAILIDKNDFASGTSSKSSKLIHGGIRYLENYDFNMVFESCQERYDLNKYIAPHLVRNTKFIYPIRKRFSIDSLKIRLGLMAYDLCSVRKSLGRHKILGYSQFHEAEPALDSSISGAGVYYDCMTNDARLVVDTIKGAIGKNTHAMNYVEYMGSKYQHGFHFVIVKGVLTDQYHTIKCKAIINATGSWSQSVSYKTGSNIRSQVTLSKGVHFVVDKSLVGNNGNIIVRTDDGRIMFILDWGQFSLIGTTDTPFSGSPDEVYATKDDINYLLIQMKKWFPDNKIQYKDIISTFAGLRPLASENKNTALASREHKIIYDDEKCVYSIIGGKLTTFRAMASNLLDELGNKKTYFYNDRTPISGGEEFDEIEAMAYLVDHFANDSYHIMYKYGSNCLKLIDYVEDAKKYDIPLFLSCQFLYAIKNEFAKTHLDILFRRTWIYLVNKNNGVDYIPIVSNMLKEHIGHPDVLIKSMEQEYIDFVHKNKISLI